MVFDAHDRAFAFFGGACARGIYDETHDYTPHAFAHHPDVPAFVVSSVLKAMVSFSNKDESLSTLGMTGFQKADDSDWSDVRDLNLDPGDTGISINSEASCPSV
jgi:hypothetical protein